ARVFFKRPERSGLFLWIEIQSTMKILMGIAGSLLVALVLWEAFETIILPRRVTRRIRLTRFLYRITWGPSSQIARLIKKSKQREKLLSFYGPLSLLMLM